jgi:hypothetical protein
MRLRHPEQSPPRRFRPVRRSAVCLLALLAFAALAQAPPPRVDLAAFDRFELAPTLLAPDLAAHERARRELDTQLQAHLGPWLARRNGQAAPGEPPRVLRIEPQLVAVRALDPAVRLALGPLPAGEQWRVRVRLVDAASEAVVGEAEFAETGPPLAAGAALVTINLPRRLAGLVADWIQSAAASAAAQRDDSPA